MSSSWNGKFILTHTWALTNSLNRLYSSTVDFWYIRVLYLWDVGSFNFGAAVKYWMFWMFNIHLELMWHDFSMKSHPEVKWTLQFTSIALNEPIQIGALHGFAAFQIRLPSASLKRLYINIYAVVKNDQICSEFFRFSMSLFIFKMYRTWLRNQSCYVNHSGCKMSMFSLKLFLGWRSWQSLIWGPAHNYFRHHWYLA